MIGASDPLSMLLAGDSIAHGMRPPAPQSRRRHRRRHGRGTRCGVRIEYPARARPADPAPATACCRWPGHRRPWQSARQARWPSEHPRQAPDQAAESGCRRPGCTAAGCRVGSSMAGQAARSTWIRFSATGLVATEQVQPRLVLTPPGPPPRAPTTNPDRRYPLGSTSWFERGRHGHDSDSPAPRHPLLPRSVFANVQQGDTVGDVAGGEQRRYSRAAPVHPVKSAGWAAHEVDRRRR